MNSMIRMIKKMWFQFYNISILLMLFLFPSANSAHADELSSCTKSRSVFFNPKVLSHIRQKCRNDSLFIKQAKASVAEANPWLALSDDQLWYAMFGPTITRAWMVWSDGFCPSCKNPVKMYAWKIDALKNPWKVQCPHCGELFPKNDFHKYYLSGLDEQAVFAPNRADRRLLFNEQHPDPGDPLFNFGVDDGEGYVEGAHRWRFIGAYLIYGQWKQLVLTGIEQLARAFVVTGDKRYAHKAAVLLDRIADLYPDFDYLTQGTVYEKRDKILGRGMISVWHDACMETRSLAFAYDQIFEGIKDDTGLVRFLSAKADSFQLAPKRSFADIQKNIETGILREAFRNRQKIISNFPQTEITLTLIQTILDWPNDRQHVIAAVDDLIGKATAADGLSGEKGLASYAASGPKSIAVFLSLYDRLENHFIENLFKREPSLKKMFRFHIDTWINNKYYPKIGDVGRFAEKTPEYPAATFNKNPLALSRGGATFSSNFSLFKKFYDLTGDPAYVQILFRENDSSLKGLPYDLFEDHPRSFQKQVRKVIDEAGTDLKVESINFQEWCLAILRSGSGADSRAVWVDYDIGGNHSHADAMNIGLFAKGLDLLPGFGYPPVQYGGWFSPKALWYRATASHNTVVVDGKSQVRGIGERETAPLEVQLNPQKNHKKGKTTLWAIGGFAKFVRVSGPSLVEQTAMQQYERTVGLVDISASACYVFDVFRVIGGMDHAKFLHGYLGALTTKGLNLQPVPDYGNGTQMSHFRGDLSPQSGWSADWQVFDYYHYLRPQQKIHLQYTDLTRDAAAAIADTWIAFGYDRGDTTIKSLVVRKTSPQPPLATAFVGVLEPFEASSAIAKINRLHLQTEKKSLYGDMNAAVQISLINGKKDLIIAMDTENPLCKSPDFHQESNVNQPEWQLETDAEICWVRKSSSGQVEKLLFAHGSAISVGNFYLQLKKNQNKFELLLKDGKPVIVPGMSEKIKMLSAYGKRYF